MRLELQQVTDVDHGQPPVPPVPELGVDEQLDVLDRELARRRAQRSAEQDRAKAAGGPCQFCGRTVSWLRPGRVGGWHQEAGRPVCAACQVDRTTFAGLTMSDPEHRAVAIRQVLGDTPAPPLAGHGSEPAARFWGDEYLVERAGFRWWWEVPGAPTGGNRPWRYTTAAELLERLYAGTQPAPPKLLSRGRRHRCPACDAKGEIWTVKQEIVPAATTTDGELSRTIKPHFRVSWTCWGNGGRCRHVEVEERPEQLQGVPVQQLPRR